MIKRKQISANTKNVNTLESKQSNIVFPNKNNSYFTLVTILCRRVIDDIIAFSVLMFPEYHKDQG